MRRTTCASFTLFFGVVSLTIRPSFADKGFLSVVVQPSVVAVTVPTAVRVEANIPIDGDLLRDSVTLLKVTVSGAVLATLGQLNDNGVNGDRVAYDNVFSTVLTLNTNTPEWMYIQVTAAYRNTLQRFKSSIIPITINTPAYTSPLNPAMLVSDDNGSYPVNEILVGLTEGAGRTAAETVASALGGTVVGFVPSINVFQIQLQSHTPAGVTAALQQALSLPNVVFALRDIVGGAFGVANDMTALQASQPTAVAAYDKVHAFDAWNQLNGVAGTFSPVTIGIIEPGTPAFSHPEFAGVNFGSSTRSPGGLASPENNDHATAVAGIIGANNRTAFEVPAPLQMNGIIAGLTSSATPAGSAIPYTLDLMSYSTISDLAADVDVLDAAGARVINMSIGWFNRAALPSTLANAFLVIPVDSFVACTAVMRGVFAHHPGILFVLAAGNYGASSDGSCLPNAGGGRDNVMTVAATDLNDARSIWNLQNSIMSSTYGAGISIAAPGGRCKATDSLQPNGTCNCTEGVYAPASTGYWQMASGHAFAGTSAAAPLVSGAAGLLTSIAPGLGPGTVKNVLKTGADPIVDQSISGMRLNVDGAVRTLLASYPLDGSVVAITAKSNGAAWPASGQMAINYKIVCNAQSTSGTLVPWFVPFVRSGTCTVTYLNGGPSQMVLLQIQPCAAVSPAPAQLSCTAIIPARSTVAFTFVFASNRPPTAGFLMSSGNQSATDGQTLSLTVAPGGSAPVSVSAGASHANFPGGSIAGWIWSVNGSQISTSPSFGQAFSKGTYQISLVVT